MQESGVNVKCELDIGFDEKWKNAHPGREERQESINEVMKRWSNFISDDSVVAAKEFEPKEGDVFIATHSKAGTTLMQQIVHQLRSNGDISFEEISLVVPWIEIAKDLPIDLTSPQTHEPRAFKTHFDWPSVPKKFNDQGELLSKYICVIRDPLSVIISFYYFLLDWFFTAEEFHFCDLVETLLYKRSVPIWEHYFGYYQAALKYPSQVLFFFFEDLVDKREECIRKVAEFIGISGSDAEERIQVAVKHSSFEWMKENDKLFDESPSKKARNKIFGAVGDKASKIRTGKTKTSSETMDPLLREEIETVLAENFKGLFGVETYQEIKQLAATQKII